VGAASVICGLDRSSAAGTPAPPSLKGLDVSRAWFPGTTFEASVSMKARTIRGRRKGAVVELKIREVSKSYPGAIRALRGVSLSVEPGVFGLLGPNGAGKTTLMRIVATLQDPDEGSVSLDGIDVVREKRDARRLLGYLPQEFGLDPRVRADEMLDHLAVLKEIGSAGERRAVIEDLLQKTHLHDVRKRKLGTFSGGMKQRFGIAQALLARPRLLVVDEPTAGLDPEERRHLLRLLSEMARERVVILSTHIVEDVAELCTRMAILDRGQVRFEGQPAMAVRGLEGRVWEAPADAARESGFAEQGAALSSRLAAGIRYLRVRAETAPGAAFRPVPPDLEDVYFDVLRSAGD
jgi:ABC-2 type transport system ATP-binding protein